MKLPKSVSTPFANRTSSNRFVTDVLKLVSGTAFAQLLGVLVSPILARLFAPEAFGALALFTSIASVVGIIACLRYELAIVLPERDEDAANLLAVSLLFAIVISLLFLSLLYWFETPLLDWLNAQNLASLLTLAPVMVFFSAAFIALNYWNSRTKRFGRLSVARVTSSLTTITFQLTGGLLGKTSGGTLIGASITGNLVSALALAVQVWKDDRKLLLRSINWADMLAVIRRYKKFPLVDSWGAFINNLSWQLPVLLLAFYFPPTIVGLYAFSFRILQLPMSLIGSALSQVFLQRASEARREPELLAKIAEQVFQKLVALSLLPAILLGILGQDIFSVFFGAQWIEAGMFTQILSGWLFFWFISSPLSVIFTVLERQELSLIVHISILLTRAVALVAGGLAQNIYLSLSLFTISGVFVYGGLVFFNLYLAKVRFRSIALIFSRYTLLALPGALIVLTSKLWGLAPLMLVPVSVIILLVYYLLVLRDSSLRQI